MENVSNVTEIAKGIGDLGMTVITAAFFLVLAAGLMIACFKWFKSIINGMIADNKQIMTDRYFGGLTTRNPAQDKEHLRNLF